MSVHVWVGDDRSIGLKRFSLNTFPHMMLQPGRCNEKLTCSGGSLDCNSGMPFQKSCRPEKCGAVHRQHYPHSMGNQNDLRTILCTMSVHPYTIGNALNIISFQIYIWLVPDIQFCICLSNLLKPPRQTTPVRQNNRLRPRSPPPGSSGSTLQGSPGQRPT